MKVLRATSAPTERHINWQYLSTGENISRLPPSAPPCAHRKVSLGSQPLGEVVEGVRLGAHRVAVPVDLVEEVSRFVQAVVTDVHILLFYILRPSCKEDTDTCCLSLLHLGILLLTSELSSSDKNQSSVGGKVSLQFWLHNTVARISYILVSYSDGTHTQHWKLMSCFIKKETFRDSV